MFSLFRKKPQHPKLELMMYLSEDGKRQGIVDYTKANFNKGSKWLIIAYFPESLDKLADVFDDAWYETTRATDGISDGINLILAQRVYSLETGIKFDNVIILESYPSWKKMSGLRDQVKEICQLEPPIFMSFNEAFSKIADFERTKSLMLKMGMQEHEAVSHSMVTKSVIRSLQKMDDKITEARESANSQKHWLDINKHLFD